MSLIVGSKTPELETEPPSHCINHILMAVMRTLSIPELVTAIRIQPTHNKLEDLKDCSGSTAIWDALGVEWHDTRSYICHYVMAVICITYLLLGDWPRLLKELDTQGMRQLVLHSGQQDLQFYDYAARFWHVHIQKLSELSSCFGNEEETREGVHLREQLRPRIATLCQLKVGYMKSWFITYQFEDPRKPLQRAAARGMEPVVQGLMDNGFVTDPSEDVGCRVSVFEALESASRDGNDQVIKTLLRHAHMGIDGMFWGRIVRDAAGSGHLSTVRLLDELSGTHSPGYMSHLALVAACRGNYFGIVHFLLSRGANPCSNDGKDTALSAAVKGCRGSPGKTDVVALLLKYGASTIRAALSIAAREGAADILRMLVKAVKNDPATSLGEWSEITEARKDALMAGQGVAYGILAGNTVEQDRVSLQRGLELAASRGDAHSIRIFMEYGAEDKRAIALGWITKTHRNRTVLQQLFAKRRYSKAQLCGALGLLFGVPTRSINLSFSTAEHAQHAKEPEDDPGKSGLMGSADHVPAIAEVFFAYGPILSSRKYVAIVETVIREKSPHTAFVILNRERFTYDQGVEYDHINNFFPKLCLHDPETALFFIRGFPDFIDVKARDKEGMTALLAASAKKDLGLYEELLDRGADPDAYTHYRPASSYTHEPVGIVQALEALRKTIRGAANGDTGEDDNVIPFLDFYGQQAFIDNPLTFSLSQNEKVLVALLMSKRANPWADFSTQVIRPITMYNSLPDTFEGKLKLSARQAGVTGIPRPTVNAFKATLQRYLASTQGRRALPRLETRFYQAPTAVPFNSPATSRTISLFRFDSERGSDSDDSFPTTTTPTIISSSFSDAESNPSSSSDSQPDSSYPTSSASPKRATAFHHSSVLDQATRTPEAFALFTDSLSASHDELLTRREAHSGKTLLHWAVRNANLCAAETLLHYGRIGGVGADADVRDAHGRTMLHEAAEHLDDCDDESVQFVRCLIEGGGVDIGARDAAGLTAADVARRRAGDVMVVSLEDTVRGVLEGAERRRSGVEEEWGRKPMYEDGMDEKGCLRVQFGLHKHDERLDLL